MKRFFLWIIGVALGVVVLLGAVMAVSYSFTGEGARPAADVQFGGLMQETIAKTLHRRIEARIQILAAGWLSGNLTQAEICTISIR